jgi:hypothetical protein
LLFPVGFSLPFAVFTRLGLYLALGGGPPGFTPGFTCPALLGIRSGGRWRAGRRSSLQGFAELAKRPGGRRRLPDGPHRVARPLGALSARRSGAIGSPLPPRRGVRPRGVPSAGLLRTGVRSGSRRLGPLSGRSSAVPGPGITAETFPSWDLMPLRRRGRAGPFSPGLPPPARSVLEVFHLRDGFLPASPCGHEGRCRPWGSHADPRPSSDAEPQFVHVAVGVPLRDRLPQGFRSPSSEEQEVRDTTTPDRSRFVRPGPYVGRRAYRGPGAFPSGALHPVPLRRPASPRSPSCAFRPPQPPLRGDASGRRFRVCPVRDRRIFERSAAPMGFPCTDETRSGASRCVHPHSAGAPCRAGGPAALADHRSSNGLPRPRRRLRSPEFQRTVSSGGCLGFTDAVFKQLKPLSSFRHLRILFFCRFYEVYISG